MRTGKYRGLLRRARASLVFTAGSALVIGLLALQHPLEVYASIDPGLDNGNAVVDRASVPGQTILKYQTSGPSTFKAPAGVTSVRVLVIGGGGGGGAGECAGGGGAGGYIANASFAVTPGAPMTVTVGGGGAGGGTQGNGTSGQNSVLGSLTAIGGGGGGGGTSGAAGKNGGSGGGGASQGASTGGSATAGQGNNGGNGSTGCRGGGGGGAGTAGGNSGGSGGSGLASDITGTSVTRAGGGAAYSDNPTSGGSGGGGNRNTSGQTNTGSGGGAYSGTGTAGSGGSGIVVVRFATQDITPASPGGVSGLTMWYKADSASNTNALWNDSSGFGYNATQATGTKQPILTTNAINFNPGYVFDGTDDVFRMEGQGIGSSEPMSVFFGANATRADGGYRYFNEFGDDTPSISMNNGKPDLYVRTTSPIQSTFATQETGIPHVYGFISPNANSQPRIVGVDDNEQSQTVTSGTYATSTSTNNQIGNTLGSTNGSGGTSWAGPIAEAMYFNRVLTPAERLKIVSYLAIKYGVTRYQGTSGAGYADSAGTTIWPADSTFKNNIAGIGRDDASALSQKQSKSTAAGDIVTIGHGAIAPSNQANINSFGVDKAFLLWGHNGAATNANTAVTGGYVRMNRIWKAVRTTSMGTIKVRVPKSAVTQGSNGVMYVSSSTTFDASSQRINMTDLGTEYEATVTSLPAATSYFSFGSLAGADIQFVEKKATDLGGDDLAAYTPGESMNYVLTVKNNGPDNAGVVTVSDNLPAGLVPVNATGGGWNCPPPAGQIVTCTRPALNAGVTAPTISIEVDTASSVTGSKPNTASASVSNDPDNSNNSASVTLPAAPKADLSIAKGHTGTPTAGNNHTYKFTVTNNGPSDVSSFTVTDTLNSKMSLVSSNNGVSCSPVGLPDGQAITCTGGTLTANGPGSTVAFDMVVKVAADYGGGIIANTGTVVVPAGTTDPTPGNNSSTDDSNVLVDTQVGITKTHTGNFTAGVNNDFTITVDNQGPSTSPIGSVTVTDTLDEDFTYVQTAGAGWDCNPPGNTTVICTNNAPIGLGGTSAITLTVLVDPIAKGSTTNTAEVSTTTPDSDLSDNISDNPVTIDSDVDLALAKGHVNPTFVAGNTEQYTFSVTNAGPSADSPSYTITDTLPTGVTFVSTEPGSLANCTGASGNTVVNCTGGAIGAGDPAQLTTINVLVGGSVSGTIDNSATVAAPAGTTDTNLANNTGSDNNLPIEPNADLTIAKTPSTSMTAGATAQYTLTAHNNGPSNVSSFTITDTLDSNLTFQTSAGCSVTNTLPDGRQEVTCTGGTINSGQDATAITLNVLVEPTATPGSTISNTATVAPPVGVNDPTPGNDSSSVDRSVVASADLAITKSHTGNFTAGANNTYTIVVTNNGPSDASEFTVSDTLPTGLTFVSGGSTAGVSASCANAGPIVTCTGGPTIGAGQSSTITLTVTTAAGITGGTTLDNTASVASATPDPNNSNNTTPADTVTVDSKADLEISKSNATDFTAGNDEDYTIGVVNHGPSDAAGFTVTDTLPATLTFVSSGSDSRCSANLQVVTCTGGALASGGNTNFTVRVHTDSGLTAGTVVSNTADVATIAPTTDPNMGNNSATDPTAIVNVTDLSIQKGHTGSFIAGQTGQYTFVVTNSGPSDTPLGDVEISDTLPEGMTYSGTYTGTNWDCSGSSGRNVTCDYAPALPATAPNNVTPTLTVTVNIVADKQGEVTNTGTVVSTLDDSDPPDDSDSDTTTITAEADLVATKASLTSSLVAGQSVTYRFTVENDGGPSQANNVIITDNLQGDFTYQSFASVSGGTWDCDESNGIVTCTLPSLAVDATAMVDVTLKIAENAPNPLANTAAVTFSGTDPTPANPSVSDPLAYSADLDVDITHEQKTYHAGDTINYTVTAINHGPSAAKDAVLTVTIPEGLTIEHVSAEKPGGGSILSAINKFLFPRAHAAANPFGCSLSGNKLTCTASTMFVGSYPLYLTGKISSSFTGQIVLAAHITSSTPDPNLSDTTASDTIFDVLAGTGQNIWPWIGGAGVMLAAGSILVFRLRHRNRPISM